MSKSGRSGYTVIGVRGKRVGQWVDEPTQQERKDRMDAWMHGCMDGDVHIHQKSRKLTRVENDMHMF